MYSPKELSAVANKNVIFFIFFGCHNAHTHPHIYHLTALRLCGRLKVRDQQEEALKTKAICATAWIYIPLCMYIYIFTNNFICVYSRLFVCVCVMHPWTQVVKSFTTAIITTKSSD